MTYRQIHTEIWDDDWMLDLAPLEKLLFVYLFSNSRTHMIGLYELPRKKISFETGLTSDQIHEILTALEKSGKVRASGTWIWVKNMLVRNVTNIGSPKMQKHIHNAIKEVPNSCPFKAAWLEHYNTILAPQFEVDTISYGIPSVDTVSNHIPAADTFCSASASVSVSDPDLEDTVPESVQEPPEESEVQSVAFDVFLQARGGAVGSLDAEQLNDLIEDAEKHRQALPRASPGADVSGDGWLAEVIKEANAARKPGDGMISLNYVKAIFDRWKADGYQSKLGATGPQEYEEAKPWQ